MSRTPSRASSYAGSQHDINGGHTALLGASKAFGRPVANERQKSSTQSGNNAAQKAAMVVGGGSNASDHPNGSSGAGASRAHPSQSSTAGSYTSGVSRATATVETETKPLLSIPSSARPQQRRSPSQQAAVLATARSPAPTSTPAPKMLSTNAAVGEQQLRRTNKPAAPPKPRRLSQHASKFALKEPEPSTDTTSTPRTTSLVDLFERQSLSTPNGSRRPEPIIIKPSEQLPIKSPQPMRKSDGITSMFALELEENQSAASRRASTTKANQRDDKEDSDEDAAYVSASEELRRLSTIADPRRSIVQKVPRVDIHRPSSAVDLAPSTSPQRHEHGSSSAPLKIQQPVRKRPPSAASSANSEHSPHSLAAQWHTMHAKRQTPLSTGDQLATAIVASSLASSRGPSPKKLEPPPPPVPHRGRHHHGLLKRTPSPKKKPGMRHTMRQQERSPSPEDDVDGEHPYHKHKTKRLVRKHPHKHHEGDRKRWLDAITERERKRYEGVWAANKGLHISFTSGEQAAFRRLSGSTTTVEARNQAASEVANIIARDIWLRSRLPEDTLEIVWALVDSREVGRLTKQEFVVGMWLIDQRLKGRKLPAKVTDSVWASVTGVGVKLKR